MSESSSMASVVLVRSKGSLKGEEERQSIDLDELFGFREARERLAEKLTHPPPPPPPHVEDDEFVTYRVFVNYVDTFNCKHLVNYLSNQIFGGEATEAGEEEEEGEGREEEEEEEEGEEEGKEEVKEAKSKVSVKVKYIILGSLKSPDAEYDKEVVKEILDPSQKLKFLDRVMNCGFIIYDISRHSSAIAEARWVLHAIEEKLEKMQRETPKAFAALEDVRHFVLVSTYMTWIFSKPLDPEEPNLGFTEDNYRKRKPHPRFKEHANLEKETVAVGKKFPELFKTLVVCSGLQYGYEEDILNFLFKLAWENDQKMPLFLPAKNCIPLIHVLDLAQIVHLLLESFPPKIKYILATEPVVSNLKQITTALSKSLMSGDMHKVPKEDLYLLTEVDQTTYDYVTSSVRMEPAYVTDVLHTKWRIETTFADNIRAIVEEYTDARGLRPLRIMIHGPPASGKTTLATKLSTHYKLPYLGVDEVIKCGIQNLKDKIEKIREKMRAEQEAEEEGEEEKEEEDSEIEGEEEEEEEELIEESMDEMVARLEEIERNMEENDGHLDDHLTLNFYKEMLSSPSVRNRGYVMDGYIENVEAVKELFEDGYTGEEEQEEIDGEEEGERPSTENFPDFVISLEASDEFLYRRVMALPEKEIQERHYGEEEFMDRIAKFRATNNDSVGVMTYMDELEVHPLIVSSEDDKSPMYEDTVKAITKIIGKPHNFGLTPEEQRMKDDILEEMKKWEEAQDLVKKQDMEQRAHEERLRKMEKWATMMDALREEEEELMAAESLPLRHYLMKYIFPTLTKGLLEVARLRPSDPVDYLAEYLFKQNPEGKMFDPEYTAKSQSLFATMEDCVDELFGLTAIDEDQKKDFFPRKTRDRNSETPVNNNNKNINNKK